MGSTVGRREGDVRMERRKYCQSIVLLLKSVLVIRRHRASDSAKILINHYTYPMRFTVFAGEPSLRLIGPLFEIFFNRGESRALAFSSSLPLSFPRTHSAYVCIARTHISSCPALGLAARSPKFRNSPRGHF